MGTNTLTTVSDGDLILAAHHNELLQALRQDLVPRNNSDVPEDIFGQLGTSALRWLRAYVKTYHVGVAANNLTISEVSAGEMHLKDPNGNEIRIKNGSLAYYVNSVLVMTMNQTNMVTPNLYIPNNSIQHDAKRIYGTFTAGVRGDFGATPFTATINNCIAGKNLFIEIGGSWSNQTGQAMELIVKVNGVDVINTSGVQYITGIRYVYTIPSNGNYSITMDYRDGGIRNVQFIKSSDDEAEVVENNAGFYKIEEF